MNLNPQTRRDLWTIVSVLGLPVAIVAVVVVATVGLAVFGNLIMLGVHLLTGY
jgi:hypothetical protein